MLTMNDALTIKLLLLVSISTLQITHSQTLLESFVKLDEYVQNCSAYTHKIPPSVLGNTLVNISFEPFQVLSVNDVYQTVSLAGLITVWWDLPDCGWDPWDYNGIESFMIDSTRIWNPIITLPKSSNTPYTVVLPKEVKLYSDSTIEATVPGGVYTSCYLDLTYYPFDEHNCTVIFVEMHELSLLPQNNTYVDNAELRQYFGTSAEWQLKAKNCVFMQSSINYAYCWFTIKRKSTFYIATFLFPIVLMSLMTLLVFCIPAESGEKMSFVVSIFVSMTVFINFMVDMIPRSMENIPRIIALIMAVIVKIGFTAVAATFVLKRYEDEKREKEKEDESHESSEELDRQFLEPFSRTTEAGVNETNHGGVLRTSFSPISKIGVMRDTKEKKQCWDFEDDKQNKGKRTLKKSIRSSWSDNSVGDTVSVRSYEHFENGGNEAKTKKSGTFAKVCECRSRLSRNRLTHRQLDKLFFWLFLVANVAVYVGVLVP